ncbi:MAG TPA: phospholipase D family protein [Burkholderiales bacterium]|nr:phospholipase D family protein [Burkholderiales bacterium]
MFRIVTVAALAFLLIPLWGCQSLPKDVARTASSMFTDTSSTRLERALADRVAANPEKTGIHPLRDGRDGFTARVLLAQVAERSLDVQYYIWRDDTTGRLLSEAVWQAAERGVRVRILLDDANTRGLDPTIAALDAHPNIEVRLFNPFANRGVRWGEAVTDFGRINRRMHNKSFVADSQAAIVGGRNIGDEYFDAGLAVGFADMDVLAVGRVVREVARDFDRYWNSESAYPAASLIAPAAPDTLAGQRDAWERSREEPGTVHYLDALRETTLVRSLLERSLQFEWVSAEVVSDDPAKVLQSPERRDSHMLPHLTNALGAPQRELDLVSPYFVPGKEGTKALLALVERGVQVRVLTNALATTDVPAVHAGYSRYREALLRGGVRLYELKPGVDIRSGKDRGGSRGIGSSTSGLHAKTFAVDRTRIFVGSFNLDPRSARLNTEMGVVLDSPVLAQRLSGFFDTVVPSSAYEVRLAAAGNGFEWHERSPAGETVLTSEPKSGFLRRFWVEILMFLPIEWLL